MKLVCPCGRVLGDTTTDLDANLNCRDCKKTTHFKVKMARAADYLTSKGEIL